MFSTNTVVTHTGAQHTRFVYTEEEAPRPRNMVSEIVRLSNIHCLPEDILELILRYLFSWGPPKVNNQGYVVAKMKNIRRCPIDLVSKNVVNRARWQHIARLPYLHSYERRVCIWDPEYYDIRKVISGISEWVGYKYLPLRPSPPRDEMDVLISTNLVSNLHLHRIDRRSDEWIGFRSWIQTHPAFVSLRDSSSSPKVLSKHWFKYELELAYPTLYGKDGWAKK